MRNLSNFFVGLHYSFYAGSGEFCRDLDIGWVWVFQEGLCRLWRWNLLELGFVGWWLFARPSRHDGGGLTVVRDWRGDVGVVGRGI